MGDHISKQGYLLEDFRLFHLRSAAGVHTPSHYHEFCKLLLLVSGRGRYWIEGHQYALEPGDLVLVGSGCVHRPEFEPGLAYERIIFYISPEFLRRESRPGCDLLDCFFGDRPKVVRSQHSKGLFELALALEKEAASSEFGGEILSRGLLLRLLVELRRIADRGDVQPPADTEPKDPRIAALMAYIDAHLTEDLSVEALAEEFYLSQFHMMRLFRACTGTSINQYITQQRLKMARELISGGMTATEGCFRSGFGSYSSFTRAYGKFFGTTPTGRKYTAKLLDESYE